MTKLHHHCFRTLLCILLSSALYPLPLARADGGAVRLSEVVGSYRITLFTSPTPVRAGLVDVSVLVQDAASSQPVPEARVSVKLAPRGRPNESIAQIASTAAATNKVLQAAVF